MHHAKVDFLNLVKDVNSGPTEPWRFAPPLTALVALVNRAPDTIIHLSLSLSLSVVPGPKSGLGSE